MYTSTLIRHVTGGRELAFLICLGKFLDTAYREIIFQYLVVKFKLQCRLGDSKQSTSVSHVKTFVAQTELYLGGKFEQTQKISHSGAFFSDTLTESFLCKIVLIDEFAECERDLDGIQVFSLNVLDKRHLCKLRIIGRAYICGYGFQPCDHSGTVSALTGDYLVCVGTGLAERQWLYDAELSN